MKSFTVPRSAVVPLGHNKVPAFGIELGFAGGRFGSDRMHPSNTSVLWRLLAAAFELETPNFFTLKRLDCDLEFSGCERDGRCCLFFSDGRNGLHIFGEKPEGLELKSHIRVTECKWDKIFYIPRAALISFEQMCVLGTQILQSGEFPDYWDCSQHPDLFKRERSAPKPDKRQIILPGMEPPTED